MGKGFKAMVLAAVFFVTALTQSGCWDQQEVERLAIVMSTALDQAPDGRIRITVQVLNPRIAAGGGGGGRTTGLPAQRGYRNFSTEGNTIFDAVRLLSTKSSRRLFFAHNLTIIISEELARERGVADLMDFFDRNPQIRRSNWVLIALSDISSIYELAGEIVPTPAQRLEGTIREQRINSFYPATQLGDFLEMLEEEETDTFASGIKVVPNEAEVLQKLLISPSESQEERVRGYITEVSGTAVFNGAKLAGWLNLRESRGLLWIRGKVNGGIITVPCGAGAEKSFALEIIRNDSKIEPELVDGQLSITVRINVQANIQEAENCQEEIDKPEVIKNIEQALNDAVRMEAAEALAKAQLEYHSDIFGFGEAVHRKYPEAWREIKDNWREIYTGIPVYVEADGKILRTGLVTKPISVR